MKQTETLTLTISSADFPSITKTFDYVLYDCSQTTETSKTINWIIDPTATLLSRTITLANTAGMYYIEYCSPYLFTLTKGGTSVSLPTWMAFTNYDPIVNEATGPSITFGTNQISEAGSYILKKELTNAGNQAINFTLNLCGLTPPSTTFAFENTASRALKLIST